MRLLCARLKFREISKIRLSAKTIEPIIFRPLRIFSFHQTLNSHVDDLFIICTTYAHRFCFIFKNNNLVHLGEMCVNERADVRKKDKVLLSFAYIEWKTIFLNNRQYCWMLEREMGGMEKGE